MKTKDNLRNLFLVLFLLLPVLALNSGYMEISSIVERWNSLEQERFANQKLGEVAANVDIQQHIAAQAGRFKSGLNSLLGEYPSTDPGSLPVSALAAKILARPFPAHELWAFACPAGARQAAVIFCSDRSASRRPMEMIMNSLIAESLERPQKNEESRRNEKLLQKVFGNGCSTSLVACDQKGIVTPVIYRRIPSFLVWDFIENPDGSLSGFFLIVRRDQDLEDCAMRIAAEKAGLGPSLPGGFIRIYASGSPDLLFPEQLNRSDLLKTWREDLGFADQMVDQWQEKGFPWGIRLGRTKLYTKILPYHRHLAVLLLPGAQTQGLPIWLILLNSLAFASAAMTIIRGLILGIWPFKTIKSRFVVVFMLAATLPVFLYVTSATAYVFDRLKADENHLEEVLATSLSDFDAGKEYLENEYISAFSSMKSDDRIRRLLAAKGLEASDEVFARIREIAGAKSEKLPVPAMVLYDLSGEFRIFCQGSIRKPDFEPVARFYGLPFTLNLRSLAVQEEPGLVLPPHRIDESNLVAMQSFSKGSEGLEKELERFRFRAIRTDLGRGHLGYIYDFLVAGGRSRFVLMIAWLDSDVDRAVIQRSASQLGIKAPQIRLVGYKRTVSGEETVLPPDRALSEVQLQACHQIADSAFSIRSGMLKTAAAGMSVVAYASKHFDRTILVGAIDHAEKNRHHQQRVMVFILLGIIALFTLVSSGVVTWFRIVKPLRMIKNAFDEVEAGRLIKIAVAERQDEMGLLTREFSQMIRGLEERRRLASLLSEHAVAAVSELAEDGQIASDSFAGVVLVSDIRDFTTMCEQNQPRLITHLLNQHVTEMAAVIGRFGGKIYKFIGDAIEAVFVEDYRFGQPPELRAALAGAAMLQKLGEINASRQSEGQFTYRIGVGLARGDLIAGETGSKFSRRDYAMFGSAFKRAEEFEALTKQFPACPLIADRYVVESTRKEPFNWAELKAEAEYAFRLTELNFSLLEKLALPPENIAIAPAVEKKADSGLNAVYQSESTPAPETGKGCRACVFLVGLFCILFPAVAWWFTVRSGNEARLEQAERNAKNFCDNIVTRLNVPDSQAVMLEQFLDDLSEETADSCSWSENGAAVDDFSSAASGMLVRLKSSGLEPSLFGVFHKPGGKENTAPGDGWKLVEFSGPEDSRKPLEELLKYSVWKYYLDHWIKPDCMPEIEKILGSGMDFRFFYTDAHARVVEIKRDGVDGYLYWQPLLMRNRQVIQNPGANFSSAMLRQKPPPGVILQTGAVLCIIDKNRVRRAHLATVRETLRREKIEFAFAGDADGGYVSDGFPVPVGRLLGGEVRAPEGWYIAEGKVNAENREHRVFLATKTLQKVGDFAWPVAVLSLLALIIWYGTVYSESIITRRFAWQLWLGLLAAAVVPITCVYTVNEWFAIEQSDMRLNEERVRMISLFEQLERRQFVQEMLEWDKLQSITCSEELRRAVDPIDSGVSTDTRQIDNVVQTLAEVRHPKSGPTRFNEMLLFSGKGWQHAVYPEGLKHEASEFNRFINAFIKVLFGDLGVYYGNENSDGKPAGGAVKDEMARDAGLKIFRTMFGSDAYFRLVHGLDLQVQIFMSTAIGCMKLVPLPSITDVDLIIFWLFFDNLNATMRGIFRRADTAYPVFTESKAMYGALKQPWTGGWEPEANKFARWTFATRAPISSRTVFAGKKCLVEARIGSHNEVMIMVGMAPESDILGKIERTRRQFLYLLVLSLAAIVILSMLVSADITTPVRLLTTGVKMVAGQRYDYRLPASRKDELGQMMLAFNSMARGLQEREVMGQMVSRAARRMAGDEESLRKAEEGQHLQVTVLYLAVPAFGRLIESMHTHELLEKTSAQVDALCGIIMNNDGEADKIIGEKILAYFYSPEGLGASNAMAMQTLAVIRDAERDGQLPFPVTAGVHAGEIIAGLLGISSSRDFTIIGDPVNTAARICVRAAELAGERYLVSESVAATIKSDLVKFQTWGSVQLKGKSEVVKLMQVIFPT